MSQTLLVAAGADFGLQFVGWAFACWLQTEKFYDMTGSLTFIGLTLGTLLTGGQFATRQLICSGMVLLWAGRLGSFLVMRIMKDGKDGRFDSAKKNPGEFAIFWGVQGVWVFATLLPVLLVNTVATHPALGALDLLGMGVWTAGFVLEALADWQKFKFKEDPANKGKFIDEGLWALSRHPNYCGEMMMWWGVLATAAGSLSGGQIAAATMSPLFTSFLLLFVSGVPMLEKAADAKWGDDPNYQAYKGRTRSIVPLPKLYPDM